MDRTIGVAWVAFLTVAAMAAVFALDPLYAWIGTPERHFGWLTWLLCAVAFVLGQSLDEVGTRSLARATAATAGVLGVWVAVEQLGWQPIALVDTGSRAVGPLGSSAFLGAAAALTGPVAVALAAKRRLAVWWACAALAAVALVASGARAAWIGAAVVAVAAIRRRALLAVGVALATVGALAFGVAGRLPDVVSDREGGVHGRLDEWRVASRVIAARPLLGTGPEGYRIAFGGEVDAAYERRHGRDPLPDRAHSAPLDVAATTGLPGVVIYLTLLALTGRGLLRAAREGSRLRIGLAAGALAYFAQSLFLFPLAELDPVAWLLAGAAIGPGSLELRGPRLSRVAAAVAVVAALVAGGLDVAADRRAKSVLSAVADERLPRGDGPRNLRPDQLRYELVAARAAGARQTPSGFVDALRAIERALDLSPNDPVALAERGRLQLEQAGLTRDPAHIARAARTARELTRRDPNSARAWARLALAEGVAGNAAASERASQVARRLQKVDTDGT